jgi:hypothetical protein
LKLLVAANFLWLIRRTYETFHYGVPSSLDDAALLFLSVAPYLAVLYLLYVGKKLIAIELSVLIGVLGSIIGLILSLTAFPPSDFLRGTRFNSVAALVEYLQVWAATLIHSMVAVSALKARTIRDLGPVVRRDASANVASGVKRVRIIAALAMLIAGPASIDTLVWTDFAIAAALLAPYLVVFLVLRKPNSIGLGLAIVVGSALFFAGLPPLGVSGIHYWIWASLMLLVNAALVATALNAAKQRVISFAGTYGSVRPVSSWQSHTGRVASACAATSLVLALGAFILLTSAGRRQMGVSERDFTQALMFFGIIFALLAISAALVARRTGAGSVAALALVLLALEVSSSMRACCGSAESSAVAQLRTINTAEVTYLSSNGGKYGSIPELISQGLLDSRFAGSVSGYTFTATASGSDYTVTAMPSSPDVGRFGYYSNPDAVIRYYTTTSATCTPCFPNGLSGAPVQ